MVHQFNVRRFVKLVFVVLFMSMFTIHPLSAQDPDYLLPADLGYTVVEPGAPLWQPVAIASTLAELAPAHLATIETQTNGPQENVDFPAGAHAATFQNGVIMLMAETTTGLQAEFGPLLESSAPPLPGGTNFHFTFELTQPQDDTPPEYMKRPAFLAFDLRSLGPGGPESGDWFIALRPPDQNGWFFPEVTVHDSAGLLSIPLNRGDYTEVAIGFLLAEPDTPQPWRYNWQVPAVSTFSGAATYQFPIELPPGRNGLAPNIDISYSSRGLDTKSYTNDIDQGALGLGWQISQIQISRRTVQLGGTGHDDQRVFPMHGNHFDLVINGASHHLVHYGEEGNAHLFYAEGAPGLHIRQIFAPDSPDINSDAVYWLVQTANGTTYRLGYFDNSEVGQKTTFVTVAMHGEQHHGTDEYYSSLKWLVDTVTDVHGNQIQYDYVKSWLPEEVYRPNTDHESKVKTSRTRPVQIRYNYQNLAPDAETRVGGSYASKIEFVNSGDRITKIRLFHQNLTTPYRIIKLDLGARNYQEGVSCNGLGLVTTVETVESIQIQTGDGLHGLPKTTFDYLPKRHIATGTDDERCYNFARLTAVNNGYGGQVIFKYDADGRYEFSVPNIPRYAMSFFVTEVEHWDGIHPDPARITYDYSSPCFDQAEGSMGTLPNPANCPSRPVLEDFDYPHGTLVGFASTTVTYYDYEDQVVRREATSFWRGTGEEDDIRQLQGRSKRADVLNASNVLLKRQETLYGRDAGDDYDFTYTSDTRSYQYQNGEGSTSLSTRTEYKYDPSHQGNVQYGNLTHIHEYDSAEANTPYRTTVNWYYPNTENGHWMINFPAAVVRYAGDQTTVLNGVWNYFDNETDPVTQPTKGELLRSRSFMPVECESGWENCNQTIEVV
jgi:hypothetical protein